VRNLAEFGGGVKDFVPEIVERMMQEKFNQ
jgi:phosphopantetheine adenylyltransferase